MQATPEKKQRLVEAALHLVLAQGYAGTSVDQICAKAEVKKGSFFHYFANKEEVCRAAMDAWSGFWGQIIEAAEFGRFADPLDRLAHLFDVMQSAYLNEAVQPGCVVGTVAQEQGNSHEGLRDCSAAHLDAWKEGVIQLLADAKAAHKPLAEFEPDSLADFMLGMVQGTLLVAKTRPDRGIVVNNVRHLRTYVLGHFALTATQGAR